MILADDWHDASREKPIQGEEVILWIFDGSQHAGHWLKHANRYQRNTRRWKVYKWDRYINEEDVIAWRKL